jgi:hypothetical protein
MTTDDIAVAHKGSATHMHELHPMPRKGFLKTYLVNALIPAVGSWERE